MTTDHPFLAASRVRTALRCGAVSSAFALLAACGSETGDGVNTANFTPLPVPQGSDFDIFSPGEQAQILEIIRLNEEAPTPPADLPGSGTARYEGTGTAFIEIGDGPVVSNGWYVGDVFAEIDFGDTVPNVDGEISNLVLEDSGGLTLSGSILLQNGVLSGNRFSPALSGFLEGLNVDGSASGVFVGPDHGNILGVIEGDLQNDHLISGAFYAPRTSP